MMYGVGNETGGTRSQLILVRGESSIGNATGRIQRVYLDPEAPPAYRKAIRAILDADLIVIGPGSLYTSVLPNSLVPDLAQAIITSPAIRSTCATSPRRPVRRRATTSPTIWTPCASTWGMR